MPELVLSAFRVEVGAGVEFDLAEGRLQMPAPRVGNPAPDFVLPAFDGSTVQLSFLRDRPVVLSFFDRCPRCEAAAAALFRHAEIARQAHMLAVLPAQDVRNSTEEEFRKATGFAGALLLDLTRSATIKYEADECPRVFVIGTDGRIRYAAANPTLTPERLAKEVSAALQAPGSPKGPQPTGPKKNPERVNARGPISSDPVPGPRPDAPPRKGGS